MTGNGHDVVPVVPLHPDREVRSIHGHGPYALGVRFRLKFTVSIEEKRKIMAKKKRAVAAPVPTVRETLRDFARRLAPMVAAGLISLVTAKQLVKAHASSTSRGTQTISGSGAYSIRDALADIAGAAGGVAGAAAGLPFGPYGAAMGGAAGAGAAKRITQGIIGSGDYTVLTNSLMKNGYTLSEGQQIPQFVISGQGMNVRHCEYCFDVVAPTNPSNFLNNLFTINPTNTTLFPWLSVIAGNFQQYKINGMIVQYKSLSSDITAGGALGSVVIATDYNVVDVKYVSKVAMENSQYATSCKPSLSMVHAIECDPRVRPTELLFTRATATSTSVFDPRFYDFANLQIATSGLPSVAGTILGEIWISYDITFSKPIIGTALLSGNIGFMQTSAGAAPTTPFGTSRTVSTLSNYTFSPNSIISNRAGQAICIYSVSCTVPLTPIFTPIGTGSGSMLEQVAPLATTTGYVGVFLLTFGAAGDGVTFGTAGWASMTSSALIRVVTTV